MAHTTYTIFHNDDKFDVFINSVEMNDGYTTYASFVATDNSLARLPFDMGDVPVSIVTAARFLEQTIDVKLSREDRERSIIESYGNSFFLKKANRITCYPWAYRFIETGE